MMDAGIDQMVSQRRPRTSRDRLVAAAAAEFAARGFDGAKVDRIAARARLNKAMLYYHFRDKADLYRAILLDSFRALAAALAREHAAGGPADDQIHRFIRTIAAETAARPFFPPIWLREMAEGGRHLDRSLGAELQRILATLTAILDDGRQSGLFRPAHPLGIQMGIVAPLLLFAASAPARARLGGAMPVMAELSRDAFIAQVEAATLAALRAPSPGRPTAASSTRRPT